MASPARPDSVPKSPSATSAGAPAGVPPQPTSPRPRARLPSPAESKAHADALADRLHSAAVHVLRRVRRTDPLTGVSPAQLSVLSVLMGGQRTIGELAAAEQVTPPTMSKLVVEMEDAGLVSRSRDTTDGRVVWIASTPSGQHVLARGRELRIATLSRTIEGLSIGDYNRLVRGLLVIEKLLEDL
jgi:DNA-binding MarR family transcriptional regulator